jgi:hypothetical protein
MMALVRRFAVCVLALTAAAIFHFTFGHVLANGDPIPALVTRPDARTFAAAAALALSRSFLLFVAPGWVLTLLVTSFLDATGRGRRR